MTYEGLVCEVEDHLSAVPPWPLSVHALKFFRRYTHWEAQVRI